MNLDTFFDNFEMLAEAPNGVKKLRELILQLAVQGKLVPKDEKDEPVRLLLENMKDERHRQIKENKIKRTNSLPLIKREEVPFDIPKHWEWIRIGDAMNLINGVAFKPSDWSPSGLPIIRIQNLNNYDAPFNYCNFNVDEKFHVHDLDFLISWSGTPGTSFGAFIWNRGHAILNQHIFRAELFGYAYRKDFLKHAINALLDEMIAKAHGGVGLQHITKGELESLFIPLPPLAEQHRIVAKVDQLMSLCDELEARQQKKHESRARLNSAALDKLLAAREQDDFAKQWRLVCDNFDMLYNTIENVSKLRTVILQLAVEGKLVPQDPTEEKAINFLERVCDRQSSVLVSAAEDSIEKPKIPDTWAWSRCESLCQLDRAITYGVIKLGPSVDNGVPVLRSSNVRWLYINEDGIKKILPAIASEYSRTFLKGGEIVVTVRGTLGGVAIVPPHMKGFNISREVAVIPIKNEFNAKFLCLAVASIWSQSWLASVTRGIAYEGINIKDLKRLPLPIPPLAEQARIVARVDQLMSLCDELEAGLARSQADGERLMEAVVGRMLAG